MKIRIDKLLVSQGFAESRTKAQALVMAGIVLVNDRRVEKSSESFGASDMIRIKGKSLETKYVGRGGLKLEKALAVFDIRVSEYVCLDIGSSTGGFTDCLLQYGARKVYAVDVGTNQLEWKLRNNERVIVKERVNARYLGEEDFEEKFDLIVMDVSFISARKILGVFVELLKTTGKAIILIKPQFEVGKGEVGKGGIVRDPSKHKRVVNEINEYAATKGLIPKGIADSPILGAEGNKEFLALYERAV